MVEKKDIHDESFEVLEEEDLQKDKEIELETEDELMGDKLKNLRRKLKGCEDEKMKALEDLQRTRADFLNSKRRLEEQFLRDKERATDKIIFDLLTLVDSFDTAMGDASWANADKKWRVGVEAIHTKLTSLLYTHGVSAIEALGKPFNPNEHEAISNTTVENDAEVEQVLAVLQKGFMRNGSVIRPARVVVGTRN